MEYTITDVKDSMMRITGTMIALKTELTEIDSRLGDGDMGCSIESGALGLRKAIGESGEETDWKKFFLSCASSLNRTAPSTMGTLLSSGLMQIGKALDARGALREEDVVRIPGIMAEAIALRGKAAVGDKTILDALVPFSDTLLEEYEIKQDLQAALTAAVDKAREGMESTKGMSARTGRAKWLGDRNKDWPDGGAYMCYRVVDALLKDGKETGRI